MPLQMAPDAKPPAKPRLQHLPGAASWLKDHLDVAAVQDRRRSDARGARHACLQAGRLLAHGYGAGPASSPGALGGTGGIDHKAPWAEGSSGGGPPVVAARALKLVGSAMAQLPTYRACLLHLPPPCPPSRPLICGPPTGTPHDLSTFVRGEAKPVPGRRSPEAGLWGNGHRAVGRVEWQPNP